MNETRVSNFKLAEHLLRQFLKPLKLQFVDVEVTFDEEPGACYRSSSINVGRTEKLAETLMVIVGVYLANLDSICGRIAGVSEDDRKRLLHTAKALIGSFVYSKRELPEIGDSQFPSVSLAHFPTVWLFLRDIICPLYEAELKDVTVFLSRSAQHDAAASATVRAGDKEETILLANLEVESDVYRSAFLLASAIEAHDLDPRAVIADLLSNPLVKDKVYGFAKMAFVDDRNVNDFILSLAVAGGFEDRKLTEGRESDVWTKEAQRQNDFPFLSGFGWQKPQLIEGPLEMMRGPDNTIREIMEPYVTELFAKIEAERKSQGKEAMTLEDMLRVQSRELRQKPEVMQSMLSSQRIW
jgi:hypothetical protein